MYIFRDIGGATREPGASRIETKGFGTGHSNEGNAMSDKNSVTTAVIDRRNRDRRMFPERRKPSAESSDFGGVERRQVTRRAKVERRRQIDPTTCERDYTADEIEFMRAMDDYKRRSGRQFPTWSEVLEVVRSLGYQRETPAVPPTAIT
jgi:hypothetical protein